VATVFAACQAAQPDRQTSQAPQPLRLETPAAVPAAEEPAAEPAAAPPQKAPTAQAAKPAAMKPPAKAPAVVATPKEVKPEPLPPVEPARHVEENINAERQGDDEVIVTTISGCLERNKSKFRLTDMIGEHAPKSRSWKTGFFRKGSAKLDLIAEASGLKFEPHVGYRVDVTGSLAKKVMHAHSLTPTSARCS
jgi:hypothetical protein